MTKKRLDYLINAVDEIAIPLDSIDRKSQEYLRKTDCLPKIKDILQQLQDKQLRIGIHTVATALNISNIPLIYKFLKNKRFDYWKIYEYNADLVSGRFERASSFIESENLKGADSSNGGINGFLAEFLLMEEKMSKFKDNRIRFIGVKDYDRTPYFFLDNVENAYFSNWFLQGKRKFLGNILKEDFKSVRDKAIPADKQGPLYDEESFIEAEQDMPLWARAAWEGNYFSEELEEISPKYHKKFIHLAESYLSRIKRQGKAPANAKLAISAY